MNQIVRVDEPTGLATVDVASELPAIFQLARALKQAQGFLPQHIKNEGEIVAVVLAGRELGIPPMAAIRGIKLVKGNVTLDAALQLALMARAGCKYEWLKDGTDGEAVLKLQRPGQAPYESRYTTAMAKTAGLDGDNWRKHTAAMLRARCVTGAGKAYMPDVLAGVYLPDELPQDEAPVRAVKPARSLDDVASSGGETQRPFVDTSATTSSTQPATTTPRDASTTKSGPSGLTTETIDAETGEDLDAEPLPPMTSCPIFQSGPDKGKAYADVNAPKLQALLDNPKWMEKASTPMLEWARFKVAHRAWEKRHGINVNEETEANV